MRLVFTMLAVAVLTAHATHLPMLLRWHGAAAPLAYSSEGTHHGAESGHTTQAASSTLAAPAHTEACSSTLTLESRRDPSPGACTSHIPSRPSTAPQIESSRPSVPEPPRLPTAKWRAFLQIYRI